MRKLKVGLVSGQVDIVGHDEPGVRVEVHSVSGKDLNQLDGDTLEIDHPQLRWDNLIDVFRSWPAARADVSILVPRDVALKLGVVSATASSAASARTQPQHRQRRPGDRRHQRRHPAQRGERRNVRPQPHRQDQRAHRQRRHHRVGPVHSFSSDGVSGDVFLDITGIPTRSASTPSAATSPSARGRHPGVVHDQHGRRSLQLDDAQISGIRGSYTGKYGQLDALVDFRVNTVSGDVSVLRTVTA